MRLALAAAVAAVAACAHPGTRHPFATTELPATHQYLAPDGSEIRLLLKLDGGELSHCTLPPAKTSAAVRHRTVEEIWYFISGQGEVWRAQDGREQTVPVGPGTTLTIPAGTAFQFRTTGDAPLTFLISTMPPWPGPDEAVPVRAREGSGGSPPW